MEDEDIALEQLQLDVYKAQKSEIIALTKQVKSDIAGLQEHADVYLTKRSILKAEYERDAIRKQSPIWHILSILLVAFMFHAYASKSHLFIVLNGVGFLMNWRKLYIKYDKYTTGVCIVIIVATYLYV